MLIKSDVKILLYLQTCFQNVNKECECLSLLKRFWANVNAWIVWWNLFIIGNTIGVLRVCRPSEKRPCLFDWTNATNDAFSFSQSSVINPSKMLLGIFAMLLAIGIFIYAKTNSRQFVRFKAEHPLISLGLIFGGGYLIVYLFSSVLVFLFGILLPIFLTLLHASMRLRNLKNKITNTMENAGLKKTPMGVLLEEFGAEGTDESAWLKWSLTRLMSYVAIVWSQLRSATVKLRGWKRNKVDLSNSECTAQPLNNATKSNLKIDLIDIPDPDLKDIQFRDAKFKKVLNSDIRDMKTKQIDTFIKNNLETSLFKRKKDGKRINSEPNVKSNLIATPEVKISKSNLSKECKS